jgi:hypothetical protein
MVSAQQIIFLLTRNILIVVVHACNSSPWEAKIGGPQGQSQTGLKNNSKKHNTMWICTDVVITQNTEVEIRAAASQLM